MSCRADATGNISPNKRIAVFYSSWVFFSWLVAFGLSFKFGKGQNFYLWISAEEMQLPWCCTRGKSGRAEIQGFTLCPPHDSAFSALLCQSESKLLQLSWAC